MCFSNAVCVLFKPICAWCVLFEFESALFLFPTSCFFYCSFLNYCSHYTRLHSACFFYCALMFFLVLVVIFSFFLSLRLFHFLCLLGSFNLLQQTGWNKFWKWHRLSHWKWQRMEQVFCQFVWLDLCVCLCILSAFISFTPINTTKKRNCVLGLPLFWAWKISPVEFIVLKFFFLTIIYFLTMSLASYFLLQYMYIFEFHWI